MGIDYDFTMFDRNRIDPILNKTLISLGKDRYNHIKLVDLVSSGLGDEITEEQANNWINTYSIKDIMKCSQLPYFFLEAVAFHFIPEYTRSHDDSLNLPGGLIGAAAKAFLEGRLSKSAMTAVFKLTGSDEKQVAEYFRISKSEKEKLASAVDWHNIFNPIYRWQSYEPGVTCQLRPWDIVSTCLGVLQSRLFLKFLEKACDENWPLLKVRKYWLEADRYNISQENIGDQEDFQILKEEFCTASFKKPCILFSIT